MRHLILLCVVTLTLAAAPAPRRIYVYDLTHLYTLDRKDPAQARRAWDEAHVVTSLQGLVNRDQPRLFVRFMKETDDFWLTHLRQKGQWLANTQITPINSLAELLRTFRSHYRGLVLYQEAVPATSNLASTIAGIEDRLCLRYDPAPNSVNTLVANLRLNLDTLRLFRPDGSPLFTGKGLIPDSNEPSTGSPKADAYLWAKHRYIDSKKCSADYMAYYIDAFWLARPLESSLENFTLTNHDFFISHKAFFFDLGMWEEESPVDDPAQTPGTDVRALRSILRSMHDHAAGKILHIGGFVPWAWKYTNHNKAGGKHGGVDSEWKYAQLISAYNGIMDADAIGLSGMANASFYQHHPLKDHYPQNKKPTIDDLEKSGLIRADGTVAPYAYVLFYMGDYDSAAWLNIHAPRFFNDPARGTIPCAWAFNPNLDRRAPHAMHFVRTHASPNDWFIAGDSGAGYLNPGMLLKPRLDPDLPDGLDAWTKHCAGYYRRYDLSITGFIIDGRSRPMDSRGLDAYQTFSPDGIIGQHFPQGLHQNTLPLLSMKMDLDGSPKEAGAVLARLTGANLPKFSPIRTILKSPTWHQQTMDRALSLPGGDKVKFVDPYTFFLLLKTHEQNRAAGKTTTASRNDVSFTPPTTRDGLSPVAVDDGEYRESTHQTKSILHQPRSPKTQYLYFEVDDALAQQLHTRKDTAATVTVTLFDAAPGTILLEYDSHDERAPLAGAYAPSQSHRLSGSGQWITLSFTLPKARLSHRQNAAADFRFVNLGGELFLSRVTLTIP